MSFTVTHRLGRMEKNPPLASFKALIAELDDSDREHTDVSLSHESGWTLSVYNQGTVVWENVQEGEPRHMRGLSTGRILELLERLAQGEIDTLDGEPWETGYP